MSLVGQLGMPVVDMLIHPVFAASESDLFDLSGFRWSDWIPEAVSRMDENGVGASGVCIMDAGVLDRPDDLAQIQEAMASGRFWFTLMPDPRRGDAEAQVDRAAEAGFRGVTWHSYLQEIDAVLQDRVVEIARRASDRGLFNGLCTAHGSKRIYRYHSLPLAAEIAERTGGATVLYHAGGYKINEVVALCEMWPNLFIETSFSLSYWLGSSVETDLAFAIRKIGADRVLFGSDAPFVALATALRDHEAFFEKHGFGAKERASILGGGATRLLDRMKSR